VRRRGIETAVLVVGMTLVVARVLWHATDSHRVLCPAGFAEDAARGDRALTRLTTVSETRDLVRRTSGRRGRLCFGQVDVPLITTDRVLLLSRAAADGETAARVAHLLSHLDGHFPPIDGFDAHAACAPQVDAALHAEARAMDLELRLRQRFSVRAPTLRIAFADAWTAAPSPQLAYEWLVTHPHGGEGVDALGDAYAARCHEVSGR
jgi:hypothetical protein